MAEYVSRSKVEFELCGGNLPEKYKAFVRRVLNDRNLVPSADVAPVVRCRDCRSYNKPRLGYCEVHLDRTFPDDFCSWGREKPNTQGGVDNAVD